MLSEKELVQKCKMQDRASQELLFKQFSGYMMGICMRYSKDKDEARDLLHDGFIKAFMKIKDFREESSLKTWLSAIFVNTALTRIRQKNKLRFQDLDERDGHEIADNEVDEEFLDHAINNVDLQEVLALVQNLPDKYRIIINMYVIDHFSHKDIANELNISEGTSKSQLSRARKMLMTLIEQKKTQYEKAF